MLVRVVSVIENENIFISFWRIVAVSCSVQPLHIKLGLQTWTVLGYSQACLGLTKLMLSHWLNPI